MNLVEETCGSITKKPKIIKKNAKVEENVEYAKHLKFVSSFSVSDEESEDELSWWPIPEHVLLHILSLLPITDILSISATCKRWNDIASDDLLWKKKFQRHFKADPTVGLKPGAESWRSEYKRLSCNIPRVMTQCLEGHAHQVLHVSFSHDGTMFATCSKDGFVIIWNSDHPCTEKYSHNMKSFSWKYTQYSQFNQSDTLLLVSGVHFGSPHSTSGEIAVFTVDGKESHLRCRVVNRPYDIFGTWFSDQYLISGDLHWLAHLVSTSVLWLNKANQEVASEHVPIMNQLYKFYNKNASSVRAIIMARCPWLDETNDPLLEVKEEDENAKESNEDNAVSSTAGNPPSHAAHAAQLRENTSNCNENYVRDILQQSTSRPATQTNRGRDAPIRYLDEYRRERTGDTEQITEPAEEVSEDELPDSNKEEYDEMENNVPRYLIFSTGSKTYTPHQIGIKRVGHVLFPKKLDPGPSLKERIAARREAEQQNNLRPDPDWWNYEAVADRFEKIDKIIDLHGHIIGMALSPDHRYLYVNTRPWPENYVINNALEPPPIAQEIDIHVIDLMTLKRVGNMLRAHKAYTPSTECFFIFLDVCDHYVASGAEDMHAYLWDRYYGICLAKYKHNDVVNSVAFNTRDSEMLVTTSDDYSIKIWRSQEVVKKLNINPKDTQQAFIFNAQLV